VNYSSERGYELSSQAESFLLSLGDQHFAVLGIVGKARTGKSYIINQIINDQVYPVHSRINTCTRGILLSPELRRDPATGIKYIVIDTEGICGNDTNEDKDSKLFLLNMLMCSMLIYNGVGVIDEQALNGLSLVIGLGKSLHQDIEDEENLSLKESSFPSFFWLIRDFVLKL
jgi:ribosome biogenesis GTPase A